MRCYSVQIAKPCWRGLIVEGCRAMRRDVMLSGSNVDTGKHVSRCFEDSGGASDKDDGV